MGNGSRDMHEYVPKKVEYSVKIILSHVDRSGPAGRYILYAELSEPQVRRLESSLKGPKEKFFSALSSMLNDKDTSEILLRMTTEKEEANLLVNERNFIRDLKNPLFQGMYRPEMSRLVPPLPKKKDGQEPLASKA